MTTSSPKASTPSGNIEDLTPGQDMHGTSVIHDNPNATANKIVRTLSFDEDSEDDLPPTQEEIDAFNNDWYERQKRLLDAKFARHKAAGKAAMAEALVLTSPNTKTPPHITHTMKVARHGGGQRKSPVNQAHAERNRFDDEGYREGSWEDDSQDDDRSYRPGGTAGESAPPVITLTCPRTCHFLTGLKPLLTSPNSRRASRRHPSPPYNDSQPTSNYTMV